MQRSAARGSRALLGIAFAGSIALGAAPARAQDASDGGAPASDGGEPASDGGVPASDAGALGDEADDIGFGDDGASDGAPDGGSGGAPAVEEPASVESEPGTLDGNGYLAHRAAIWSERLSGQPFAQARQTAGLAIRYKKPLGRSEDRLLLRMVGEASVEYDFAYLHDRNRFDQPTLDAYEANVIGRETYISLSWGVLDLTFGRQIVPFGQGEILSPLDIVNPRDVREPGLAELADIRLAVLASRAGLFFGNHRLELLVVHESYFGMRPPPLADFSTLRKLALGQPRVAAALAGKVLRYEHLPGRFVEGAGQPYARYSYKGGAIELALYGASTLDKPGLLQAPAREELAQHTISLRLWHPRYYVIGHAGALPFGPFVLRWELGIDLDRPLAVQADPDQPLSLGVIRRHQLNGMLGVTFFGIEDTQIWLEYMQRRVLDNPERDPDSELSLFGPVEAPIAALRLRHSFMRQRLELTIVGTCVGVRPFVGAFARAELNYELFAAFHLGIGYAAYFPSPDEPGPFYGFDKHDRLYADVRWDFALE